VSRPLVDFIHTDDLVPVDRPLLGSTAPVRCRTLSVDPDTGGASVVVDVPAGWIMSTVCWSTDIELMVLSGVLCIDRERVLRLGYLYVPSRLALPEVRADEATRVLVFTSAAAEPGRVSAAADGWIDHCVGPVQLADLAWEQPRTPGFPAGSGRKTLRLDHESGQGFWALGLLPHWDSAQREWHEFAEENYVLEGEIETTVGVMTPGAYLSHPPGPEHIHGPMRSRRGALIITRSAGPFATTYEPAPDDVVLVGPWP
jgi:hypothetical protein